MQNRVRRSSKGSGGGGGAASGGDSSPDVSFKKAASFTATAGGESHGTTPSSGGEASGDGASAEGRVIDLADAPAGGVSWAE